MKKLLLFTGLFTSLLTTSLKTEAQRKAAYGNTSIGARLTPDGGGFVLKTFLNRNIAFEGQLNAGGIFAFSGESFNAVGLLEYHITLPDAPAWKIYFGGGAHTGVWANHYYKYSYADRSDFIIGIDGIGGVEYNFKKIPLALSGDFKPAINFAPDVDFFPHNCIGASARFYIGR